MKKTIDKKNYIRISFCQSNEQYALEFIRKLEVFINEKYSFVMVWNTRNARSFF